MAEDKPLPNPHKRPWERQEPEQGLMADRMARAMAEGRLEEFFEDEFKDNENAQRLAEFMMQMTGMAPPQAAGGRPPEEAAPDGGQSAAPPEDEEPGEAGERRGGGKPGIPEEISRIAAENGVEVEWLISRALSLYIRDYRTTGRL